MYQSIKIGFQRSGLLPILLGFGAALAGILVSSVFFEEFVEMASTGLIALSLTVIVNSYLEDNRRAIWESDESPIVVNALLAARLSLLFLGIFLGALFLQTVYPSLFYAPELELEGAYKNEFAELLRFNFTVLFGGALFSMIYRAGGVVTILAWNAIHWSNSISSYIMEISESVGTSLAALVSLSLIPHLLLEVVAYVIAGMVGIFLSKAIFKYHLLSDQFSQVAKACLLLLIFAGAVLSLSVTSEIYLAQNIFHAFTGRE